jgi:hypothetical protein
MAGERVSGLAGGGHHYRIVGGREIGDDPQARAKALGKGVGIVADCARPTIERVVCARCRDRDVEPIAQYRDPTEEGVGEHRDMRPPPLPLRHIGSVSRANRKILARAYIKRTMLSIGPKFKRFIEEIPLRLLSGYAMLP